MPADRPETCLFCPFCLDTDFDLVGLKLHLTQGDCDEYVRTALPARIDCPTPPAPAGGAGDAERDNSIYDDAAEYLAERDAMIAEREAHRAVVDAARAVLATRYRDGWGWFVAMDDRDEYAKWNGLRAAIADLRGTKGLR